MLRTCIFFRIITLCLFYILLCAALKGEESDVKIKAVTIYYLDPWAFCLPMSSSDIIARADKNELFCSKIQIEGPAAFGRINKILELNLRQQPASRLLHDSIDARIVFKFWTDNDLCFQLTFQHYDYAQWNNIEANPLSEKESREILSLLPKALFDRVYNPEISKNDGNSPAVNIKKANKPDKGKAKRQP